MVHQPLPLCYDKKGFEKVDLAIKDYCRYNVRFEGVDENFVVKVLCKQLSYR